MRSTSPSQRGDAAQERRTPGPPGTLPPYLRCHSIRVPEQSPSPASCGSAVKNPPTRRETWVQSLVWEDPLKKRQAAHSSILACRIPWLYSLWGCKESDTTK